MIIKTIAVGPLQENCYLAVSGEKSCAIIDPGDECSKILDKITKLELTPKVILLTHCHYDHIGAVLGILKVYPNIPLYLGEGEKQVVDHHAKQSNTQDVAEYIIENGKEVKDDDIIMVDELKFRVIQTPGHTQGGVCYTVGDSMFSGDTLFYGTVGRCDLYTSDYKAMFRSIVKIYSDNKNYTVYPGHDRTTSLDKEKQINHYVQEALGL